MNFDKAVSSVEIHWKLQNFKSNIINEIKETKLVKAVQLTFFNGDNKTTWILKLFASAKKLNLVPHLVYADNRNFRVQLLWLIPTRNDNVRQYLNHFETHCNLYEEFSEGLSFSDLNEIVKNPSNYYMDDDTLMTKVRIDLIDGFEPKSNEYLERTEELSWKYEQLFTSKRFSDLTIVCSDGVTIQTHRLIISANSSVLNDMLHAQEVGMMRNRMFIDDVRGEVMEQVLIFMYGQDSDHLTQQNFAEIFNASEKYQIPNLQEKLVEKMITYLSVDSVFPYIQLAVLYRNNYLLQRCLIFIKYNVKELLQNPYFSQLGPDTLIIIKEFIKEYKIKYFSILSSLTNN